MFLEILIAVFIALSARVGNVGAIIVVLISAIPLAVLTYLAVNRAVMSFVGMGSNALSASKKAPSRREKRIAAMGVDALREWIVKHPRDIGAWETLCRKLKEKGDREAYARGCEHLLSIHPNLDVEERSMRHHKLADLYAGPLKSPEKAREILRDFIDRFSGTSQAELMRRRLKRLQNPEKNGGED